MKPVIGVICETSHQGLHQYHQTGDKYLQAVARCADCIPLLIPALSDQISPKDFLPRLDGLLLTGGYSNVDRRLYREPPAPTGENEDYARDALSMSLIPSVLVAGMPLFGICRGFQELNVALGGTLHPRLQEVDGRFDHRENTEDPIEVQYGPAHSVTVAKGGILHNITDEREFMVNSVHGQGIHKLAAGLIVKQRLMTAPSRPPASKPALVLPSPCNGTQNGRHGTIRSRRSCLQPLVRLPVPIKQKNPVIYSQLLRGTVASNGSRQGELWQMHPASKK